MLERVFHLQERGTNVRTEVIAGITTFMTMAYIIFVNPSILKAAGVPAAGAMTATILAAALMTIAMGLFTNYPFAIAAGMGLNAVVAFTLVKTMGLTWQVAMGVIFWEGLIITILVLTNIREAVMNAIPLPLKQAIGVGIGLFIALIGLKEAGIVVANPATLIGLGDLTQPATMVALIGLIITAALVVRRVKGALLLGIILTTIVGLIFTLAGVKVTPLPTQVFTTHFDFSTIGRLDIMGALKVGLLATIFAIMLTDFFDTMGTVISVGGEAGLLQKDGTLPGLRNVLLVDSLAAVVGGLFGASSNTTYIESAAGVSEGGRTGLTSVVTGILFLLSLFFVPLAGIVPAAATAPALIIVGFLMLGVVREIDFAKLDTAIPAFLTLLGIPLTYSIANGIGFGFISYVLLKVLNGKFKEVHWLMYLVALLFILNFFFLA